MDQAAVGNQQLGNFATSMDGSIKAFKAGFVNLLSFNWINSS
jgi:hypothetical protein